MVNAGAGGVNLPFPFDKPPFGLYHEKARSVIASRLFWEYIARK
jgi:hypothetical protein